MREFIVLVGVLLLLLTFPLQYALEHQNHNKEVKIQKIVHTAKEKAKQKGRFTPTIKNKMIDDISSKLGIDRNEIITTLTETEVYRSDEYNESDLIHYKIEVPFDKIIATPEFFGISANENKRMYPVEGYTSSELPRP